MGRRSDPSRGRAYQIYKENKGDIKLSDIARMLEVQSSVVRNWKKRDNWVGQLSGKVPQKKHSTQKKQSKKPSTQKKPLSKKEIRQMSEQYVDTDLTPKQELFCYHFTKCFNAVKAYQKAFECTPSNASSHAWEMMKNPKIVDEINRLKQHRFSRDLLTTADIFQKYMDIAFMDLTDFIEFGTDVFDKIEYNYVRFKRDANIDGTLIQSVKKGKDGISLGLPDRMQALKWLSEHMDLATDEQKARINMMNAKSGVSSNNDSKQLASTVMEKMEKRANEKSKD